jgi:hypothetical protein
MDCVFWVGRVVEGSVLRKTRAGGMELTGGIVVIVKGGMLQLFEL